MFCKNCGTKIKDDEKFCEKCKKEISEVREKKIIKDETVEEFFAKNDIEKNNKESNYVLTETNDVDTSQVQNNVNMKCEMEIENDEKVLLEIHPDFFEAKECIIKIFLFIFLISAIYISNYYVTFEEIVTNCICVWINYFFIMEIILLYKRIESKKTSFKFLKNRLKYKCILKREKEISYREILHVDLKQGFMKNFGDNGKIVLNARADKNLIRKNKIIKFLCIITMIAAAIFLCTSQTAIDHFLFILFIICGLGGGFYIILFLFAVSLVIKSWRIRAYYGKNVDFSTRTVKKIKINNVEDAEDTYEKIKSIVEGRIGDI